MRDSWKSIRAIAKQQLLQICADSECPENKPYVELYLRELE